MKWQEGDRAPGPDAASGLAEIEGQHARGRGSSHSGEAAKQFERSYKEHDKLRALWTQRRLPH